MADLTLLGSLARSRGTLALLVETFVVLLVTAVVVLFAEDSLSTWIAAEDVSTEATFAGSRVASASSSSEELSASTWIAVEDVSTEATVAGVGVSSAGVRVASAGISFEVSSVRSRGVAAGAVVDTGAVCSASFCLGTVNCASNVESTEDRDV